MSLQIDDAVTGATTTDVLIDDRSTLETLLAAPACDHVIINGKRYLPHPNGGGLVAITAFVGNNVYVADTAMVMDDAIVLGRVRLLDRSIVRGTALVEGRCSLAGDSIVEDNATLKGMVTPRRHARVGGIARLEGSILLDCRTRITRGHLVGPLSIS